MPAAAAIIMRSKNEMPHLRSTLEMLQRQTYRSFKLFVIDSGSTDGSLGVLQEYRAEINLTQIAPDAYVPGNVLNEAIARTDTDIIVLLNADAIPCSEHWLEQLIRPIVEHAADATYSRQIPRTDAPFIVAYDYERAYAPGRKDDHFFSAAACAFRRNLWERHKFPNEGYAEDSVWATSCRMLNARFQFVPESEVEHSHAYTLKELYRKRFRHGNSFAHILGETSPIGRRCYLCARELIRDLIHACRKRRLGTIPYNIAYRMTMHAGLHRGIREGSRQ